MDVSQGHEATVEAARIRDLALGLDALPADDLALLCGVKHSTLEAWRKRGTGPSYVLLGTRYFYPISAVAAFLRAKTRPRANTVGAQL